MKSSSKDRLVLIAFLASCAAVLFGLGIMVGQFEVFPYGFLEQAAKGAKSVLKGGERAYYYKDVTGREHPEATSPERAWPGLNLIMRVDGNDRLVSEIRTLDGEILNRWDNDWFAIWPDATHVPEDLRPKKQPGTVAHGAVVMPDGDLVFNFESLGLIRLDPDGNVVWRLAYQTHHSVRLHDDGTLWVCGQVRRSEPSAAYPDRPIPHGELTLLQVGGDGEILREWSVPELLDRNGYASLYYFNTADRLKFRRMHDDRLHLNDVEPFPAGLEPGVFGPGDAAVSLRNVNAVFVFDTSTDRIEFMSIGRVIRQHDVDFLDGNTISLYDNNHRLPGHGRHSRIVTLKAPERELAVAFEGRADAPFYSPAMGKHQWLPNGNLLITEPEWGRAFEVAPDGEIVWQFLNVVEPGVTGMVAQVERLPESYARFYSRQGSPTP